MTRKPPMDAELQSLLERGKVIRRVPDAVRARVLGRARALSTGGAAVAPASSVASRKPWLAASLAAAVALVVGAAGAAIALRGGPFGRSHETASTTSAPSPHHAGVAQVVSAPASVSADRAVGSSSAAPPSAVSPGAPSMSRETNVVTKSKHAASAEQAKESYRAELDLLQRAQAAYVGHDYGSALALATEHVRRFPNGRLAEEREALRIRSLAGSGRVDEARRATEVFAQHFPRSVLLPRLQKVVGAH